MDSQSKFIREYHWQTRLRKIIKLTLQIAVFVFLGFLCAFCFGQRVVVTESSMEPTLVSGSRVLLNKAAYAISEPDRGDIIAFEMHDGEGIYRVKRVIGLPGETIQIKEGKVYINEEPYQEDFPLIENPGVADIPVIVGKDEYFVLGDNRNESEDSRHLEIGLVEKRQIKGKLWLRYSPGDQFGIIQ